MNKDKSRAHTIKELPAETLPRAMIFVDTETSQTKEGDKTIYQDLRLGVALYWEYRPGRKNDTIDTFRFTDPALFWEYVISKVQNGLRLCLFAHNAVFDMVVLQHIKWLEFFGYRSAFVFDKGTTFIGKWQGDNRSILILNTANWFQGSVERWGAELNLPKLEMPDDSEDDETWFIYCERDAMVLLELTRWYFAFLRDNDLGPWKFTIAAQAFAAFRHRFMTQAISVPDIDVETELARKAYKGGRTEVFKVGHYNTGPYYKLDVNSMYPYVMSTMSYPVGVHNTGVSLSERQIRWLRGKKGIIAHCTVQVDKPYFVEASTGRNLYPIGTFDTYLTTEEFYLAFDKGWLRRMHSYALYEMRPIFSEYVDYFYKLKVKCTVEGKRLQRAFTKLYLNSLYGKFGQRGYVDEVIGEVAIPGLGTWYAYDVTTGEHYLYRLIGHTLQRSTQSGESYHSFCAIAAHVTANARLLLYNAIEKVGREHVYYSDTDSMIVDAVGFDRMQDELDDTRLGAWGIEAQSDSVTIKAAKHYLFDGKWTMKGVRKTAKVVGEDTYEQEQWPGLSTILKSGTERYFNTIIRKTLRPEIKTGTVQENGDVWPIMLHRDTKASPIQETGYVDIGDVVANLRGKTGVVRQRTV